MIDFYKRGIQGVVKRHRFGRGIHAWFIRIPAICTVKDSLKNCNVYGSITEHERKLIWILLQYTYSILCGEQLSLINHTAFTSILMTFIVMKKVPKRKLQGDLTSMQMMTGLCNVNKSCLEYDALWFLKWKKNVKNSYKKFTLKAPFWQKWSLNKKCAGYNWNQSEYPSQYSLEDELYFGISIIQNNLNLEKKIQNYPYPRFNPIYKHSKQCFVLPLFPVHSQRW